MPNWERTPPVCGMSIEEIKKRVADGIKNRMKKGLILPERQALPGQEDKFMLTAHGPRMSKAQRIAMIQQSNLAIYALCNEEPIDYCQAAETLNALRKGVGYTKQFTQHLFKGIAEEAAEITGRPFPELDLMARRWLAEYFAPSGKVISIAKKGNTHGNNKGNKSIDPPGSTTGEGHQS